MGTRRRSPAAMRSGVPIVPGRGAARAPMSRRDNKVAAISDRVAYPYHESGGCRRRRQRSARVTRAASCRAPVRRRDPRRRYRSRPAVISSAPSSRRGISKCHCIADHHGTVIPVRRARSAESSAASKVNQRKPRRRSSARIYAALTPAAGHRWRDRSIHQRRPQSSFPARQGGSFYFLGY